MSGKCLSSRDLRPTPSLVTQRALKPSDSYFLAKDHQHLYACTAVRSCGPCHRILRECTNRGICSVSSRPRCLDSPWTAASSATRNCLAPLSRALNKGQGHHTQQQSRARHRSLATQDAPRSGEGQRNRITLKVYSLVRPRTRIVEVRRQDGGAAVTSYCRLLSSITFLARSHALPTFPDACCRVARNKSIRGPMIPFVSGTSRLSKRCATSSGDDASPT
eukprot:scaffold569_cov408-Prasinococcus_capsulatus_cf.AAC.46